MGVIKATLEQKPVERFVCEDLSRSLAVVESFGNIGVGSGKYDEGEIVASIAGTAAVVFAVGNVEGMAGGKSGSAPVALGIGHGEKVSRIY